METPTPMPTSAPVDNPDDGFELELGVLVLLAVLVLKDVCKGWVSVVGADDAMIVTTEFDDTEAVTVLPAEAVKVIVPGANVVVITLTDSCRINSGLETSWPGAPPQVFPDGRKRKHQGPGISKSSEEKSTVHK